MYHIVIKGIDKQIIFEEKKDYKKYLEILSLYKEECNFKLFAYCLMSNHVHLLLQTSEISLETIFRKINTHYAVWFNMKYQRTGHIQDGRYYSEPIEDNHYLYCAIKYIHANPVHAGIEPFPGHSYPWTSIYEYKSHSNNLVDTDFIYSIFEPDFLLTSDTSLSQVNLLDIDNIKKRIPDDVAKEIILSESNCNSASDFLRLPLSLRNYYLRLLHQKGLSIRQLSRLTGVSIGVIQRVTNTKGRSS